MLALTHHASAGGSALAIDSIASDGGFHLLYVGTVGVTLFDEPRLLAVKLVGSFRYPALDKCHD